MVSFNLIILYLSCLNISFYIERYLRRKNLLLEDSSFYISPAKITLVFKLSQFHLYKKAKHLTLKTLVHTNLNARIHSDKDKKLNCFEFWKLKTSVFFSAATVRLARKRRLWPRMSFRQKVTNLKLTILILSAFHTTFRGVGSANVPIQIFCCLYLFTFAQNHYNVVVIWICWSSGSAIVVIS